jgi:hypothetical protein
MRTTSGRRSSARSTLKLPGRVAQFGHLPHAGVDLLVGLVGRGDVDPEIVRPADDVLEQVAAEQRGEAVDQPRLAQRHARRREAHLDLPASHVRDGDGCPVLGSPEIGCHQQEVEDEK